MNLTGFSSVEFGICTIVDGDQIICRIPIDDSVRESLVQMHNSFYEAFLGIESEAVLFEPSEKYSATEKLRIQIDHENLEALRSLFNQTDIPISQVSLSEVANNITFYFAIFLHNNGAKQIGIKRPSQFKGLLRKQNQLVRLIDDTLQVIPDDVFKLDNDFDFVIHQTEIDILHPTGFIFIANIEEEILRTAANATRSLATRISFIGFNYLADFVGRSKTAAKLVASIKSRGDLERTSLDKLRQKCASLNVILREDGDQVVPEDEFIIHFLQILDRREYDVDLTDDEPEIYVASSRKKID